MLKLCSLLSFASNQTTLCPSQEQVHSSSRSQETQKSLLGVYQTASSALLPPARCYFTTGVIRNSTIAARLTVVGNSTRLENIQAGGWWTVHPRLRRASPACTGSITLHIYMCSLTHSCPAAQLWEPLIFFRILHVYTHSFKIFGVFIHYLLQTF